MKPHTFGSISAILLSAVMYSPAHAQVRPSASMTVINQYVNDVEGDYFLGAGDQLKVSFYSVVLADPESDTLFRFALSWSNGKNVQFPPVLVQANGGTIISDVDDIDVPGPPYDPSYECGIEVQWKYPNDVNWNSADGSYNGCAFSSDR